MNNAIIFKNCVKVLKASGTSCNTNAIDTIMNISQIHEGHHKFLMQSVKFCQAIDPYIKLLGLNMKEVTVFKEDVQAVLYIAEHYKSFANSFIVHNKTTLQKRMAILVSECLQSINYTHSIGNVLGIEEQEKNIAEAYGGLEFPVICKN